MRVYGSPFAINWRDLPSVIAYCKKLNARPSKDQSVVFRHNDRSNYGITHKSRAKTMGYTVIFPKD